MKSKDAFLVLHDIRSAQNVGSLFRTSDAAGVKKIFLTGYTPAPLDRFDRPVKDIAKTALGAEKTIPWEKLSLTELLARLKDEGVSIVAIEQDENALSYREVEVSFPAAFILGNEVEGLPAQVLAEVDAIAEIPMRGTKESLNVAVAGGVALFSLLKI